MKVNSQALVLTHPSFFLREAYVLYDKDYHGQKVMCQKTVTKKLSFNDTEISNLREKILNGRNDSQQWSKVQIVLALIWKTFKEIDQRTHGSPRKLIFFWPINLRGKTASPIPKDSSGNFSALLVTECDNVETTTKALGDRLRDTIKTFIHDYLKVVHDNKQMQTMVMNSSSQIHSLPPTAHKMGLTSWCNSIALVRPSDEHLRNDV